MADLLKKSWLPEDAILFSSFNTIAFTPMSISPETLSTKWTIQVHEKLMITE
jgi:hypothetical protein